MAIKDPKELFVQMLSELRDGAERSTKIFEELGGISQDSDVKEALHARAFVADKILATLDECFKVIHEKPVKSAATKLHDTIVEDLRRELTEIQSPETKRLFVLANVNRVLHFRIADYKNCIAIADHVGHYGVGALLDTCLADVTAFGERAGRLLRERQQQRKAA